MDAWPKDAGNPRFRSGSGHGSGADPCYTFDISPDVVGIMLNTASPDGGTEAVLDAAQADWLEEQLSAFPGSSTMPRANSSPRRPDDRLVILFSHHPLSAFDEARVRPATGPFPEPIDGPATHLPVSERGRLGERPRHKHRVTPHKADF